MAALARRQGMSIVQATALSLGLTALLLLAVVAPSLLEGWRRELPTDTPNWFVLNLQDDQRDAFAQALKGIGANQLNMLPLAVGKLTAINGRPIDQLHFKDERAKDSADRQLRLSWSNDLPPANKLIAGQWFAAQPAQAQVSVDTMWRDMYHLKLGDTMRFDVGEGQLDATVTSFRQVDWSSFRVNFFLLLDPAHAQALPHTWLGEFLRAAWQCRSAGRFVAHISKSESGGCRRAAGPGARNRATRYRRGALGARLQSARRCLGAGRRLGG